jgi:hypothetical protein
MIPRTMLPRLLEASRHFPVATLFGPRQSGKTTLAKAAFPDWRYVNLEQSAPRRLAQSDPTLFFREFPRPLVVDEVQRVPELLSEIQVLADETNDPGQFVLTGSHQPLLQDKVAQSLAGRTALLDLYPLSLAELASVPGLADRSRDETLWAGGLPRIFDRALDPPEVCEGWFRTYVERDVRQILNVANLGAFETFVRLLAGRVGQVANLQSLAGDVGVSAPTLRSWLSVLEASYVVFTLRPYWNNYGKRLVKSPKIYFSDTGLACWLLGISRPEQVGRDPLLGGLFENLVVLEALKWKANTRSPAQFWFFRDNGTMEIDLLMDCNRRLHLFEIKAAMTPAPSFGRHMAVFRKRVPEAVSSTVVYAGPPWPLSPDGRFVPFSALADRLSALAAQP